ncbi:MAG: DNA polymerase III subunit delta [Chloroflexi bacterium GWC2_73_18]|nr:MAG: DNA polymerase III subunit delta [Chloroflexi bacterium GWC2_73_18]
MTLASIAPGNGLALVELVDASARPGASLDALREAVDRAGGEVRQFRAPTRERMEALVETRARELGLELERGAARLLAQRVGAFVREGDVDRRRQGQLASAELEKLAVYRPDGRVNLDDVRALVPEAVPGTTWGFLDAIGSRRSGEAMTLLDRLLTDGTAPTALVFQLHRRLRELLAAREHLAAGATAASLVRAMKLKPFRAEKLAEQARAWSAEELERALDGLFAVDVAIKGLDGAGTSEAAKQLTFELWLIERVARASQR